MKASERSKAAPRSYAPISCWLSSFGGLEGQTGSDLARMNRCVGGKKGLRKERQEKEKATQPVGTALTDNMDVGIG